MYKKILWWSRNHPEKPLSYSLIVAAIFHEKCDPEPYFQLIEIKEVGKEKFIKDCNKSNQFAGKISVIERAFKDETGFDLSDLIGSEIWQEIIELDSINDYFSERVFNSQKEISTLCKKIYSEYLNEKCFTNPKKTLEIYGNRGVALSSQMWNLSRTVNAMDRWAEGTANQFWFGSNAIRCITRRVEDLLKCEQTPELYLKSALGLKEYFAFSDLQIEMFRYFICQSVEGNCPAHKNKAIYIWGDTKDVGKTTIASTIISILNGEKNILNVRKYESDLPQELGYKEHTAPMICSCRAVLMDEAMIKDSSKSYGTFKKRITSDGVKIRFVYSNQIDVQAKANYVFTSNDPLEYFIQDKKERRFLEFHVEKKHSNLTYEKIYDIFLKFVQQCKRPMDWIEWSDSMAGDTEVRGIESKNIDDIRSFFEMEGFKTVIENSTNQVSIGTFYKWVNDYDRNATKQLMNSCIIDLFGEPYKPSTWKKIDILEVLIRLKAEENEKEIKAEEIKTDKKVLDAEDIEMKFDEKCPFDEKV
jgi:hypothetical protein